MSDKLLLPAP